MLSVAGHVVSWLGLVLYRACFFDSSWRDIYVYTTLIGLVFGVLNILLILRLNLAMGIPGRNTLFTIQSDLTEVTRKLFNIIIMLLSRYYHASDVTNSSWFHPTQLWFYRLLLCIGWKGSESVGSDTVHAFLHHVCHAVSTGNTTTFSNKPSQYTQHTLALS